MKKLKIIIRKIKSTFRQKGIINNENKTINMPDEQDLDLYWDDNFGEILEKWGENNVWNEIQLIFCNCNGKVLDIACGTGITIQKLIHFKELDIYGFDISDKLISRAINKGLPKNKLKICNATATDYKDNEFHFSYSIGSLEHFTEKGLDLAIKESFRYTKQASFHMVPVSRSNENEGWLKTTQSFFNNSSEWWFKKFRKYYSEVKIVNSGWEDEISVGKWYLCYKDN